MNLTGIETKNNGVDKISEFNQESLAAADKWGHQLSDWRWVTLQQNNQFCQTDFSVRQSLQYTVQPCIIVNMYRFFLMMWQSIALPFATYDMTFDLLCPAPLHSSLSSIFFWLLCMLSDEGCNHQNVPIRRNVLLLQKWCQFKTTYKNLKQILQWKLIQIKKKKKKRAAESQNK